MNEWGLEEGNNAVIVDVRVFDFNTPTNRSAHCKSRLG
jgi:hypothetical protein